MKKLTALLRHVKTCINLAAIILLPDDLPDRQSIAWYSRFPKSILLLFLLFVASVNGYSQQNVKKDKDLILEKVNQFFEALEKQDTILFRSIIHPGGHTWAVKEVADSVRISVRSFEDRLKKFINPEYIIQERALDVEIKIHQQVAMAWVPYELDVSGKFEHCGVDIFTLVKSNEGWKIVTVAFTMEPDGCEELKKR
ncbi:MAG TPA: nuclear transport factor 2 family protein [Saprospiraceae bacterium]|nr:nuclear transport factor 2 family protein [Saprospiraceae bacterium]